MGDCFIQRLGYFIKYTSLSFEMTLNSRYDSFRPKRVTPEVLSTSLLTINDPERTTELTQVRQLLECAKEQLVEAKKLTDHNLREEILNKIRTEWKFAGIRE